MKNVFGMFGGGSGRSVKINKIKFIKTDTNKIVITDTNKLVITKKG